MEDVATQPSDLPASGEAPQQQPALPRLIHVAGHDLRIYVEWPPLCSDMLEDIRRAEKRVWLEVYIFHNDSSGQRIAQALMDRARAGLDVRVMYDAIGSMATPAAFFAEMAAAGVQLHCYHPLSQAIRSRRFLRTMNRRNHRKLLVIDDIAGYFGGMNIVENSELTPGEAKELLPISAGWRDVHLRVAGPQVVEIVDSIDRSWRRARGEKIRRRPRAYRRGHVENTGQQESIRFFDSGPGWRYSRAARVFTGVISSARQNITISMAYFIPTGRVLRALEKARRDGIRVRVIVPGKSDVQLVQYATRYLYSKLVKHGVRIYEREERMLHSKVVVADGRWAVVGSANLDPRSLWINLEFLAVIRSERLACIMLEICRYEIDHSRLIRRSDLKKATLWQRFRNTLAWGTRWLL